MKSVGSFLLLLGLILSATGCASYKPAPPRGILTLENQKSGERETLTYLRPDGRLDEAAAWRLSYLMRDVTAGAGTAMDPRLFSFLDSLSATLGLPVSRPVIITSGYRTPETNARLRQGSPQVAENSYHMRGQAADIKIRGIKGARVARAAKALARGGVAHYPRSDHVHIDVGPVRSWRTY